MARGRKNFTERIFKDKRESQVWNGTKIEKEKEETKKNERLV